RVEGTDGVRHKLRVAEVGVEDSPRFEGVPDVQNAGTFGGHESRMDALMDRRIDLRRLVHDDEDAARLGVNTLDRAWIVGRKTKHKPARPKPNFRLQELGP